MSNSPASLRLAVAQGAPALLDRSGSVERACDWIAQAGRAGARLVALAEAFIPGYPDWVWALPAGEEALLNELYARFLDASVEVPGADVERLCAAARAASVYAVIGISERNREASGTSLYNSLLTISDQGQVLGVHRKLVPTGGERLIWAQGDGSTLAVHSTPFGRIGGLICWENYMPLARYALYAWGVQIYVAATWDRGGPWLATLRHIAKEARAVVLGAGMCLRREQLPDLPGLRERYAGHGEWINTGGSAIAGPDGNLLAGPLNEAEGLLTVDIDPAVLSGPRWMLDVAGHYARPDVFELRLRRTPRPMLRIVEERGEAPERTETL
jgi:nitrilase